MGIDYSGLAYPKGPIQAVRTIIKRLKPGEQIPHGEPRRYLTNDGYVVLRWRVGRRHYIDALEHRVIVGLDAPNVHHRNGNRTDNRPENLESLSASEHARLHIQPTFDVVQAAQLYGAGWSFPRLAAKYGIHQTSIMRTLKAHGLQPRPRPGFGLQTVSGRSPA